MSAGTRLGVYEILSLLGAGGMGEVYKARDTRLDRLVAIKILPEALAADPQFRERFDREARTISQLDHPHVCTLYDVGEQGGTSFLVMQYLEGETLEARLKRDALPLDETLQFAIQIADALDKAHRAGIVHRDLKPGNIMLTKSGAKPLDFGLAKTTPSVIGGVGSSVLPTTPPNLTSRGAIFGTFQYMAPEQLEGAEADTRTDIFAFGAVMYEMVTGRKAFEAKSHASLIGAILKDQPSPLSAIQPVAPPALDRVVQTCLIKNADDRWQSARDLLRELQWIAASLRDDVPGGAPGPRRTKVTWLWSATAVLFGLTTVVLAATVVYLSRASDVAASVRFTVPPPEGAARFGSSPGGINAPPMAVSPDGRWLVFGALAGDKQQLWIRSFDELVARPLSGTEGCRYPFWSPDSRSVAFFTPGDLRKIDVAGGTAQKIADVANGTGGAWNRDGTILVGAVGRGLFRVAATGGPLVPVASSSGAEKIVGRLPFFLPDGRHFVYLGQGEQSENDAIYVGSLDSSDRSRVVAANRKAQYASGRLLFVSGETLMAQPFDLRSLRVTDSPAPVFEPLALANNGYAAFSVSETGVLAVATGARFDRRLIWFDRSGKQVGDLASAGPYGGIKLLPDGRVVVSRQDTELDGSIWVLDPARGTESRLTTGGNFVVSPDGQSIAFAAGPSDRARGIRRVGVANPGTPDVFLRGRNAWPTDWSPDGRLILPHASGSLHAVRHFRA